MMASYKKKKKSGKVIRTERCPDCAAKGLDTSEDNLAIYDDKSVHCFACGYHLFADEVDNGTNHHIIYKTLYETLYLDNKKNNKRDTNIDMTYQFVPWRNITSDTMRFFNVKTAVAADGKPMDLHIPYASKSPKVDRTEASAFPGRVDTSEPSNPAVEPSTGQEEAFLVRPRDKKDFWWKGDGSNATLFGKDKFPAGSAKAITITEGALDAMSVYQMLGSKWPAVSVRSSGNARTDCERERNYLNSFEKIYICFDNDNPGQEAARQVAKLFDVNKVYFIDMGKYKDANEILMSDDADKFQKIWFAAKRIRLKGVVTDYDEIESILAKEINQTIATYPFPTLNQMSYGIRSSEVVLLTAQEKVGKTEVFRAIEHHLLKTTEENVGIIHLEEQEKRSVQGLIGYELGVPVHLPDNGYSLADQLSAYKALTKREGRLHIYTHYGSDDPDAILDVLRYLVGVCHCKFVFLDHITMLVTGYEGDDERKRLDYLSTRFAMLTRELDFTLFLVSHVNDDGKTRGSRNISKVADIIVALDRDTESDDVETRNTTSVMVKGNRFAGVSGPAGKLEFDPRTFKMKEKSDYYTNDIKELVNGT